ncbi:hypothetical protein DLREEDagrD3_11240 [Denitratisoma sp. agr-D3]
MSSSLQLALKKQRLVLRSTGLRQALAVDCQPLSPLFTTADKVVDGVYWLRARPGLVAAAAALVVVLRPRTVFRWGRRGLVAWRLVRLLQDRRPS